MRPNYAQDAPPTEIAVGGAMYPVNVDYRVWIDVLRLMRQLRSDGDAEVRRRNAGIFEDIQTAVFGGVLADEEPGEIMKAIADFARGYPTAPMNGEGGGADAPVYSFEYDLNEIIIAIRNQSGIDLSYRRTEPFHWWEFLLEFRTLCGDHYILNLIEARGYKGKDKDLLKRKYACALPAEYTADEQAAMDEFNAQFYGC